MKRTVLYTLTTLMSGCLLAACAGNEITLFDTWNYHPYNRPHPPKCVKLLVTGVSDNYERRRLFEDVFTHELQSEGINAVQSYLVTAGPGLSREIMMDAVKTAGADCVITTRLESIQEETKVIPAIPGSGPDEDQSYFAQKADLPEDMTRPREVTRMKTTVETRLFEAGNAKKIWATRADAFDVTKLVPVTRDYARTIFKVLKKDGLL